MKYCFLIFFFSFQLFSFSQLKRLDRIENSGYKAEFIYDANNVQTESFYFDNVDGNWVNDHKYSFFYNTDGFLDYEIYEDWINSQFENFVKLKYHYNDLMLISSIDWYYWNEMDSQWELRATNLFYYNNLNQIIEEIGSEKYVYIYNNDGKLIEKDKYNWDEDIQDWETTFTYKTVYLIDNIGNTSEVINMALNGNEWRIDYRTVNIFNNSIPFEELIIPLEYEIREILFFEHLITQIEFYDLDDTTSSEITNLYYSDVALSLSEKEVDTVKIYPNPVKDGKLYFNLTDKDTLDVFISDINGRIVLHKNNISTYIDLKNLQNGIYIYKVIMDTNVSTGRIIKK